MAKTNAKPTNEQHVHHHFDESFIGLLKEMHGLLTAIHGQGEKIMSAISDFVDRMKAYNTKTDAAIDGLVTDVKTLNDKITALQNSAGQITPEDQALLDGIEANAKTVSEKLAALDAQTPPPAPPVTP